MNDELYFEESGSGDTTIVFLHYFGGSSRTWKAVIDSLNRRFRCLAIDLPGFGSSAPLSSPATVEAVAEKAADLLEKLQLNHYVLAGHSMGGKIAMQIASGESFAVRKLILIAPSPPTPEPMTDEQRKKLAAAYGDREALEDSAKSLAAGPLSGAAVKTIVDDNLRIAQTAWNDWINVGSREDISPAVKKIRLPVTVISGEKDPNFSTLFLQKEITACLPQAQFIEIKNAGHLLPLELPTVLAQKIEDALS